MRNEEEEKTWSVASTAQKACAAGTIYSTYSTKRQQALSKRVALDHASIKTILFNYSRDRCNIVHLPLV
jgi:hypothetical protein